MIFRYKYGRMNYKFEMGRSIQSGRKVTPAIRMPPRKAVLACAVHRREPPTFTVVLGTADEGLFGDGMSGARIEDATLLGYVSEGDFFVARDPRDGALYIVHPRMVDHPDPRALGVRTLPPTLGIAYDPPFAHQLGAEVRYTFDVVTSLMGQTIRGTRIIHRIHDDEHNERWYVLALPAPHWDPKEGDNWWAGYDIRKERDVR